MDHRRLGLELIYEGLEVNSDNINMAGLDDILNYKKEEDYYQILGCDENSSVEQINAEYKIRARQLHPDKNDGDEDKAKEFQLLTSAKDTLTNPESRKDYDTWRSSGMSVRFEQWMAMKDKYHTSMHWAIPKKKDLMLESEMASSGLTPSSPSALARRHSAAAAPMSANQEGSSVVWLKNKDRDSGELLQKFRNYEI